MIVRVEGIEEAQSALNKALQDVTIGSELMLNEILSGIEKATISYVPVHTAFLLNSRYRITDRTQTGGVYGEFGFTAPYGAYIYNNDARLRGQRRRGRNAKGHYWDNDGGGPGAQPRWLNLGVDDFIRDDLSRVIARFQP